MASPAQSDSDAWLCPCTLSGRGGAFTNHSYSPDTIASVSSRAHCSLPQNTSGEELDNCLCLSPWLCSPSLVLSLHYLSAFDPGIHP